LVTAVAFGIVPALRGARDAPLAPGSRRATVSRRGSRTQSGLVALQVALALVMVAGSALLLNSFWRQLRVDPGFDAADVVVLDLRPPAGVIETPQRLQLYERLRDRVAAIPGVRGVALAYAAPGSRGGAYTQVAVPDSDSSTFAGQFFRFNPTLGPVFELLRVPVEEGRASFAGAAPDGPLEVVLNRAAASLFFPGEKHPVGRLLRFGGVDSEKPLLRVIGIVGDVRQRGPAADPEPQMYVPFAQQPVQRLSLLVKVQPGAPVPGAALREAVAEVAPGVPIDGLDRLRDRYLDNAAEARFLAFLLAAMAGVALLLAAVGTYATASHLVSRRLREVGVRRALGAGTPAVLRLVLGRALAITAAGLAVGLGAALVLGRFLEGLVFGITPRDPATLAGACIVLVAAALLASLGPARRAARADPSTVLRAE